MHNCSLQNMGNYVCECCYGDIFPPEIKKYIQENIFNEYINGIATGQIKFGIPVDTLKQFHYNDFFGVHDNDAMLVCASCCNVKYTTYIELYGNYYCEYNKEQCGKMLTCECGNKYERMKCLLIPDQLMTCKKCGDNVSDFFIENDCHQSGVPHDFHETFYCLSCHHKLHTGYYQGYTSTLTSRKNHNIKIIFDIVGLIASYIEMTSDDGDDSDDGNDVGQYYPYKIEKDNFGQITKVIFMNTNVCNSIYRNEDTEESVQQHIKECNVDPTSRIIQIN